MPQQNKHPKHEILKVIVGSRAHGLATPSSDTDYKSVFKYTTNDLIKLDSPHNFTSEEGTSFEIKHFLNLAVKSNPTILEMFKSPIVEATDEGYELVALFPHIWSSKGVYDAFRGYSHNQKKKMLDNSLPKVRNHKFAVAHLRVLISGIELLQTDNFIPQVKDDYSFLSIPLPVGYTSWKTFLMDVKEGRKTLADVIAMTEILEDRMAEAFDANPDKQPDFNKLDKYLIRLRYNSLVCDNDTNNSL